MKLLHILKSEPDENSKTLIDILSEGQNTRVFPLYEEQANYEELIDLIYDYDKIISWW